MKRKVSFSSKDHDTSSPEERANKKSVDSAGREGEGDEAIKSIIKDVDNMPQRFYFSSCKQCVVSRYSSHSVCERLVRGGGNGVVDAYINIARIRRIVCGSYLDLANKQIIEV